MDVLFGEEERHPLIDQLITRNSAIMVGKPTVNGTRLTVERMLEFLADDDWSSIYDALPGITEADVRAYAAFAAEQVRETWLNEQRVQSGASIREDASS